jgi:tetratricopeptide (TPR) repeat protein
MLDWFDSREAVQIGAALADEFTPPRTSPAHTGGAAAGNSPEALQQLLKRADSGVRPLNLNFYQKAKFANSFKWRLLDNGVAKEVADKMTQSLVMHLAQKTQLPASEQNSAAAPADKSDRAKAQQLFNQGNSRLGKGAYAEAVALFEQAIELDPSHAESLNNLGTLLPHVGRHEEAEQCFRQAIAIKPNYADPYSNLGILLKSKNQFVAAEAALRRALKLMPTHVDARVNLGVVLTYVGRLRDARACFAKVLKANPGNVLALQGMGQIAASEGRFNDAETTFKRILELDPKRPAAWSALANLRKMTIADADWFAKAEEIAASGIDPLEEAHLRFAMGKYGDEVGNFAQAFQNYKRGNELLKNAAENYDRKERSRLVDELIRGYSREAISTMEGAGSDSVRPVFVVGMPRSGTSLAEQIIASHPAAHGAGELTFWERLVVDQTGIRQGIMSQPIRVKTAEACLRVLKGHSAEALRVIDKAPLNSDFLGIIYSVFPNARVIYMQRDPIDTCLSCYFQHFLSSLNFTLDLSDLAHYYREHRRLMAHWRAVLPPGFILDVPYEQLVADQEGWSRKMLQFIGLEWDDRCLNFHESTRQVVTSSAWQVRQKIYSSSVARWRNYEKFIAPLLKGLG